MSFSKGQRWLVLIVAVIVSLILMSMDRWFFDSFYAVLAILCIAAGIWFFRWGAKKPEAPPAEDLSSPEESLEE